MATIRSVVNGTKLTATITGLNPYTNYDCYVTANTSVGEGILSTATTARTYESSECIICLQHIRQDLQAALDPGFGCGGGGGGGTGGAAH